VFDFGIDVVPEHPVEAEVLVYVLLDQFSLEGGNGKVYGIITVVLENEDENGPSLLSGSLAEIMESPSEEG